MGLPAAHQPVLHLVSGLKTTADPRRAVLVERTPKTTLKLQLENTAPLAPTQPQKQPLAPMGLLQHSWILLLRNSTGQRDGTSAHVSR